MLCTTTAPATETIGTFFTPRIKVYFKAIWRNFKKLLLIVFDDLNFDI